MAIGDQPNIVSRLRALLPSEWFPNGPLPILDSVLSGLASALAAEYNLLAFTKNQMRLANSSGGWLDLFAYDFFGNGLLRRPGEGDAPYLARISENLFAPAVTRAAMVQAITNLTGVAPTIFEPWNPIDTGGYFDPSNPTQGTGCGYGVAGGYGSYLMPGQCFITVQAPALSGLTPTSGYGGILGGYGVGRLQYIDAANSLGSIVNAEIYAAIDATKAAGVVCWTNIIT